MGTKVFSEVQAIHCEGNLHLLDPLDLPEGATVRLLVEHELQATDEGALNERLAYPTRLVPADRLDALTGLVSVGGDALSDSEALYDPDWD